MRVIDLLFRYATPGTVVVDLTAERAELSNAADGATLGLTYVREPRERLSAPRALVLHTVLESADRSPFASERPTDEVVHVVFVEELVALIEYGVLADAADHEHELLGIHQVRHRVGRFAAVLARVADPARIPHLRVINEYRYSKLRMDGLEADKVAREAELTKARARLAIAEAELPELPKLRREAQWQKKRGDALERQLAQMVKRLESARTSVSFRIGRATTLALKGARKDITAVPRRWLEGFRGKDEILEQARDELTKSKPAASGPSLAPTAVELEMYRLGRPAAPPSRSGVAGIASPRFAAELAASATFTTLVPHAWRAQLTDLPAYVLVTSDGLAQNGTWISWGTIGARDGEAALRELAAWCRDRGVPIVYWDTIGGAVPPRDVHFDVRFSVALRDTPVGTELLAPAIEPTVWNPDGVDARAPVHAIYSGGFDRRGDRGDLAVLEGALRAATAVGLQIFDPNHGVQGTFAEMVRFPDSLATATRRRPLPDAERAAIAKAGVLIAAPAAGDAPSWQLLRGLALGAHVLACSALPSAFADAVETATDEASAKAAFDRMFARPRLDANWRRAYDHVVASYALRDRLDAIAERVRTPPVAVRTAGALP